jgi:ABC-type branched-subunit amino acid transport system substrate-binding protein/glycosylphosphatidylinositol transamidase (GPIT) subunit GPI8
VPSLGNAGGLKTWIWLAALALLGACSERPASPVRVGVLLPVTGADSFNPLPSLKWAQDNVNAAGGVAGRPLELVIRDLGELEYRAAADQLLADDSIVAVIGPDQSRRLFELAPRFICANKLLISPTSTSADVYRAYAGSGYVWRVTESDIAQIKTMLLIAQARAARRVALITSYDPYGATFFDAFGFFATELGLSVTQLVRYDQGEGQACADAMTRGLEGDPDVLFAVATSSDDVVCLAREFRQRAPESTQLMFTDTGFTPFLIEQLGAAAEGLSGTALAPDQSSGYEQAYRARFGVEASNFAANFYDSVLLVALALQRSEAAGGAALSRAMQDVVDGRGETTGWDKAGVARALASIAAGAQPDLEGATGPLQFDSQRYTDLTFSTYMHWRVQGGRFVVAGTFPTYETENGGQSIRDSAIFETRAGEARQQALFGQASERALPPRTGLWALILASSRGFENYRHQADALAQYQLLRERGVPDDHIVLILADDLAAAPDNPEPGAIRNRADGPELYADAQIDYRLDEVSVDDVLGHILHGRSSARLPAVIRSGEGDDLFLFVVGHGGRQGVYYGAERALDTVADAHALISPEQLAASLSGLASERAFRRTLLVVEACHGGVMGSKLEGIAGVVLISGANAVEDSLSANFDPALGIWRADEFASQFLQRSEGDTELSLADLYHQLYLDVPGSHVSIYNAFAFGDLATTRLGDFLSP